MTLDTTRGLEPHAGGRIHATGAAPDRARAAMILIHGRGASAQEILLLAGALGHEDDVLFLAPQAANGVWYPYRFMEPTARNQPQLDGALSTIGALVEDLGQAGLTADRTVVLGFSQGACLALEFGARNPRRYGGLVGLSGGLIGDDREIGLRSGDLSGTPVILGCSDVDGHIPLRRVKDTTRILGAMGAEVDETIYPGMGHGVVEDEVRRVRTLLDRLTR